jgi:acyl carrier protein
MRDRVVAVVSQVFGIAPETIRDETSPETVEHWDSLRHMDLVLALEEEFGVRFSDEQILGLLSVGKIVQAVEAPGTTAPA